MKSNKKGRSKQRNSSRQASINHYFGGKRISHQSTLTQFFKFKDESTLKVEGEMISQSNPIGSTQIQGLVSQECKSFSENEERSKVESEHLSGDVPVRNPFKKSSSKFIPTSPGYIGTKADNSLKKSLSLKVRKRKYRTLISPRNDEVKMNSSKIPKMLSTDGTTASDIELMTLYGGQIKEKISLSGIDNSGIKALEATCGTSKTLSENSLKKPSQSALPESPSFSPHKNTLKCFSPLLEKQFHSLDTSAPLFPTPEESNLNSAVHTPTTSSRRALFSTSNTSKENVSALKGDSGLMDDINLSDILDQSDLLSDLLLTSQPSDFCRYLVLETNSQMSCDLERSKPEVMLRLFDEKTNVEKICYLRDDWLTTDVQPGDTVQLNAEYDRGNACFTIDNSAQLNSIVVNPDTLISSTSVANSVTCIRRAVLSEKFKSQRPTSSKIMVIGQLLHEVFQRVLLKRKNAGPQLCGANLEAVVNEEIHNVLSIIETLDQLFCLEMSEADAFEMLSQHNSAIVEWCDRYMHSEPVDGKGNIDYKVSGSKSSNDCYIAITDIQDIEECIWSPRFGLKGKVDVSVAIKERGGKSMEATTETVRVPLELKTGKMFRQQGTIEHRAQVALYTLMLGDRYVAQPPGGLLYYMKAGHMQRLPSLPHEIRGLINARNHLSRYQSSNTDCMAMPGLLKDKHTCNYCPCLKECMLYHRSIEQGDERSSGVDELFSSQISHLSPSHLQFFLHWYSLIAQEEAHCKARTTLPFWLIDPEKRGNKDCCLANLKAKPPTCNTWSPLRRQTQLFCRAPSSEGYESHFSINDRVVVSRQDGRGWAVTMGIITKPICDGKLEVLVDKALPADDSTLYRIDPAPAYGGGTMAGSLADFCTSDSKRDQHLRNLIIDLQTPKFQTALMTLPNEAQEIMSNLNSSQKHAIFRVLMSEHYTLILGMPGTGKTTTIASLVRLLVLQGKSVLLTSYTHSAVDNILLKLKNRVNVLRLGSSLRVHPSVLDCTPSHLCGKNNSLENLERLYLSTPVVATTCLGVKHPLFARRTFDVCIIDEASQITLPVSLGPLQYASVFVLVGDHYQLPPLVQSQQAREGGLDLSLFRYLSEHHPSALVSLELQYRMNREIMSLSNKLIYRGSLKCGTEEVVTGKLCLPHLSTHSTPTSGCPVCEQVLSKNWLKEMLEPSKPVLFLDTDKSSKEAEAIIGDHLCNPLEAKLVASVVGALVMFGLAPDRVGVITPLRYQQTLIQQEIQSTLNGLVSIDDHHLIEVDTIDKYQGKDKECIVMSFVRSNPKRNTGALLKDWRRINVALTRAKHKLILVGSISTLRQTPLLECMLNHLVEQQSIVHFNGCDL